MRTFLIGGALLLIPASAWAQADPASLPAHDRHEGLLIAADPYADSTRVKARFGKANPLDAGILPIEVFFRNETSGPIRIDLSTIRLDLEPPGQHRQQLEALAAEDVAGQIAHPGGASSAGRQRRLPGPIAIPLKDKKQQKLLEILYPLSLQADVVPPSATLHGFIFFDLNHDFSLLSNATLYVPDVKSISTNKPLTYFEVDLRRAARH